MRRAKAGAQSIRCEQVSRITAVYFTQGRQNRKQLSAAGEALGILVAHQKTMCIHNQQKKDWIWRQICSYEILIPSFISHGTLLKAGHSRKAKFVRRTVHRYCAVARRDFYTTPFIPETPASREADSQFGSNCASSISSSVSPSVSSSSV